MDDKTYSTRNDFIKHLRLMHFTLVVLCVSFIVTFYSDRQSTLKVAKQQIDEISQYVYWTGRTPLYQKLRNANLIHKKAFSLRSENIQIGPAYSFYKLSFNKIPGSKILFSFNTTRLFLFKNSKGHRVYDFRPNMTLNRFKENYNSIFEKNQFFVLSLGEGPDVLSKLEGKFEGYIPGENEARNLEFKMDEVAITPHEDVYEAPYQNPFKYYAYYDLNNGDEIKFTENGTGIMPVSVRSRNLKDRQSLELTFNLPVKLINVTSGELLKSYEWLDQSFASQFKALDSITKDWGRIEIRSAKAIIDSQLLRESEKLNVFGVGFPTEIILSWGILIILIVQIYFFIHFSEFLRRDVYFQKFRLVDLPPWLILYTDWKSSCVFHISVVILPLLSVLAAIYRLDVTFSIEKWGNFIQVYIVGILVLIMSIGFIFFRRRLVKMLEEATDHN